MQERQFLLHAMLEGATDGIWVKDLEGRYRMMSRSGARFLGIDAEDAVGKNDFELFPAKIARKVTVDDREILESGQERTAEEVHTVNGVARTFETKKGPCRDANGQVVALIGVFQDVTERNLVHEELRKAQDELQSKVRERTADLARTNESLRREIAEHRLAQDALRESESRYRELVELSPDAIFVHAEGEFLFVNSAAVKLFGATTPDELIGTSAYDVINREYRALAEDRTRQVAAGGEPPFTELKVRRRDGSTVVVEVIAKRINYQGRPAILSIHRDVSERKQAEEALEESRALIDTVVNNAPIILWAVDRESRVTLSRGKALEALGLKAGELVGQMAPDRQQDRINISRALAGEEFNDIVPNGDAIFDTRYRPLRNDDGEIAGVIGVDFDVTELMRAEGALRATEERLQTVATMGRRSSRKGHSVGRERA